MAPLSIISDGISRPHPYSLRNRPILLQLFRQLLFNPKSFMGGHCCTKRQQYGRLSQCRKWNKQQGRKWRLNQWSTESWNRTALQQMDVLNSHAFSVFSLQQTNIGFPLIPNHFPTSETTDRNYHFQDNIFQKCRKKVQKEDELERSIFLSKTSILVMKSSTLNLHNSPSLAPGSMPICEAWASTTHRQMHSFSFSPALQGSHSIVSYHFQDIPW